jgi:hypothetical protein
MQKKVTFEQIKGRWWYRLLQVVSVVFNIFLLLYILVCFLSGEPEGLPTAPILFATWYFLRFGFIYIVTGERVWWRG